MPWKLKINGTFFIALIFVIVSLFLVIAVTSRHQNYSRVFMPTRGRLELSESDFRYSVLLSGEWEYFDRQLLTLPDEAAGAPEYVMVPHVWNGMGYGSYRLIVNGVKPSQCYSLFVPDMGGAYRLFIDGVESGGNGQVAREAALESLHWEPEIVTFITNSDSIEIVMQVSNFHSYPGGFLREMKLGLPQLIQNERRRKLSGDMVVLGGLLIIALYNLCLFLLNTSNRSTLFFYSFQSDRIPAHDHHRRKDRQSSLTGFELASPSQATVCHRHADAGAFYSLYEQSFPSGIPSKGIRAFPFVDSDPAGGRPLPPHRTDRSGRCRIPGPYDYLFHLSPVCADKGRQSPTVRGGLCLYRDSLSSGNDPDRHDPPPGADIVPLGIFIFTIFQSLVVAEGHSLVAAQNRTLHHVAVRDDMTGLFKKRHFRKLIEESLEKSVGKKQHGMMFVDMDNFKQVNDSYGHDTGDELIIMVARALQRALRSSDKACRYGGDEFVIWLEDAEHEEAEAVAGRILRQIAEPVSINGHSFSQSVSIGLSFYPGDAGNFDGLMEVCDRRMYLAKRRGKNRFMSRD